jgi:6-phosphogluconolactonase
MTGGNNVCRLTAVVALGLALTGAAPAADEKGGTVRVYIGTSTGGNSKSKGIYLCELDLASGKLTSKGLAAEAGNPNFLALHPNRKFLYAVGDVTLDGKKTAGVSAFAIEATGKLTLLNEQSARGAGPCHISVDKGGKNVLIANYSGGSIAALPIGPDGKLAPATAFVQHEGGSKVDKARQEKPHAHSINLDPAGKFAFVADLGMDKVMVYRFDADKGGLAANDPPSVAVAGGAGPRHFAFHPDGKHAYVINELNSTLTAFDYDAASGTLKEIHTVPTLPEPVKGNSTAEVQVHPSGKFVYGSNRGHNSIAIFQVDEKTGRLTPSGHATKDIKTPRNFGIDPTGTWMIVGSQAGNALVVFKIDPKTGALTHTETVPDVPTPICIKFLNAGS